MKKNIDDYLEIFVQFALIIFIFLLLLTFGSVFYKTYKINKEEEIIVFQEIITTDITINNITSAKYSHVYGALFYEDKYYSIDNGSSGYYYKRYNLLINQIIKSNITVTKYKSGKIKFSNWDISEYEIK